MKTNAICLLKWAVSLGGMALLLPLAVLAQGVGIGTATPDASAALDIRATGQGVLLPRLTQAQRLAIASPATGLLVYQTNDAQPGFWYTSGPPASPGWTFFNPTADNLGNHTAQQNLNLQSFALVGTGASIGTAVGVGIRADGGLNLGQNTTGNNLYLGYLAGQSNTTGYDNQFSGYERGFYNTTGHDNQFSGYNSGGSNTTGSYNQFSGAQSGLYNTAGSNNQFSGYASGFYNSTGTQNLFSGYQSGYFNTTGNSNQFSGYQSGYNNTTGTQNLFSGYRSGYSNTMGNSNQFSGYQAGYNNTTGTENQFSGFNNGYNNTTGFDNQFSGYESGFYNTTGHDNQFGGYTSGGNNTTGSYNQFIGVKSGLNNTTGSNNTAFGFQAGPAMGNLTNAGAIGYNAQVSLSNALVLGGTGANAVNVGIGTPAPAERLHLYGAGTTVLRLQSSGGFGSTGVDFWSDPQGSASEWRPSFVRSTDAGNFTGGLAFYTNGTGVANAAAAVEGMRLVNGRLGIGTTAPQYTLDVNGGIRCVGGVNTTSDQRLKQDVRPLAGALAAVGRLRGVRYTFRRAAFPALRLPAGEQVGVLAQEVEQVYPELVSTDAQGFKAVNYAQLAPVLIEAIKELKAQNEALQARAAALEAKAAQATAATAAFEARLRRLEAGGDQARR